MKPAFGTSRKIALSTTALAGLMTAMVMASDPARAETFDLNALVEAAKKEAPINIYDSTGKIVEMAENFTAQYGVKATGL